MIRLKLYKNIQIKWTLKNSSRKIRYAFGIYPIFMQKFYLYQNVDE